MKIPAHTIDQFVARPAPAVRGVLLYGPDAGLGSIRSKILCKSWMNSSKEMYISIELSYKRIKKDPSLLADELYALSLLADRKIIRITETENSLTSDILELLRNYQGNHFMIWIAEELPTTSSLRKCFETEKHLAALPCYKDDSTSLKLVIMNNLKEHGYNATIEAIDLLSHRFSGDRLVVLNELQKLYTYKSQQRHIVADDVNACVTDQVELSLDSLCHAVASGQHELIMQSLHRIKEESIPSITVIRTLLHYFTRLHVVMCQVNAGEALSEAITTLKPPLFFKNIPLFKKHVSLWNEPKLSAILKQLAELEQQCKHNIVPDTLLLEHFLCLSPNHFKIAS